MRRYMKTIARLTDAINLRRSATVSHGGRAYWLPYKKGDSSPTGNTRFTLPEIRRSLWQAA